MNVKTKLPKNLYSSCCNGGEPPLPRCTCDDCIEHDLHVLHLSSMPVRPAFKKRKTMETIPEAQSAAEVAVDSEASGSQKETNVEFVDAVEQYQLLIGRPLADPSREMAVAGDDNLATFMSRPIRIFSKIWEVNESPDYYATFNPWSLFLNDAKVLNKIETFKLLQGTLKLKFMVNGSPFHYGRMFVGVRPTLYDNNTVSDDPVTAQTIITYRDENNSNVKTLNALATLYSQRPHVFLDPATNQPQQISWPFFQAHNWLDLNDPDTVDAMGAIEIWELNKLQHSNGATDPIEISCFAWMEDVTFAGLTALAPSVAQSAREPRRKKKSKPKPKPKTKKVPLESNEGEDEYTPDGVISYPATIVSRVADVLSEVPVIGKFALATKMASTTVSDIARMFGFSKPAVLTDTVFVRPQAVGNYATAIGSDPLMKLTFDPKQELTVDPSTVGLDDCDQMSFGYIFKKESFIDQFNWNTGTTQDVGLLYSLLVHPMVTPIYEESEAGIVCQSSVSYVGRLFQHWTGSLRYRFQIVASQYHRGRLLFVYEPSVAVVGTIADTNDRFSHIVDITEERDVTFEVNWAQSEAFRRCSPALDPSGNADWAIEGPAGTAMGSDNVNVIYSNGRINVYVLNTLASPIDTSNVQINVFISGGDSLEFKNPGNAIADYAYANSTVTVGPPSAQSANETTSEENAPEQDTMYVLNGGYDAIVPEQSHVFFGENICSVRTVLKRFAFHRTLKLETVSAAGTTIDEYYTHGFPHGPGPSQGSSPASALTPISGPADYNICNMVPIRYFAPAYVGWRGSIRWKLVFNYEFNDNYSLSARRVAGPLQSESRSSFRIQSGSNTDSEVAQNVLGAGNYDNSFTGITVTSSGVNPTLEVEIPYQNNLRYAEVNAPYVNNSRYNGTYKGTGMEVDVLYRGYGTGTTFGQTDYYCATGEDFSLFWYIGAPPLVYSDATTVTPA